jgi:hypothetical protein
VAFASAEGWQIVSQLQRYYRSWLIFYGPHTGLFYAFPLFDAAGTWLEETEPAALIKGMRDVQELHRVVTAIKSL